MVLHIRDGHTKTRGNTIKNLKNYSMLSLSNENKPTKVSQDGLKLTPCLTIVTPQYQHLVSTLNSGKLTVAIKRTG